MSACTFFGHKDCPASVEARLRAVLEDLITNHAVTMFYVGNQGAYDGMVRRVLRQLKKEYPFVEYAVVLAYVPNAKSNGPSEDFSDTMLPEGIEMVHPKYAISWRNKWMLRQADYVVTYVVHSWGGAAQFAKQAERQNKTVINLSDDKQGAVC